jgi:hypothetical protein
LGVDIPEIYDKNALAEFGSILETTVECNYLTDEVNCTTAFAPSELNYFRCALREEDLSAYQSSHLHESNPFRTLWPKPAHLINTAGMSESMALYSIRLQYRARGSFSLNEYFDAAVVILDQLGRGDSKRSIA